MTNCFWIAIQQGIRPSDFKEHYPFPDGDAHQIDHCIQSIETYWKTLLGIFKFVQHLAKLVKITSAYDVPSGDCVFHCAKTNVWTDGEKPTDHQVGDWINGIINMDPKQALQHGYYDAGSGDFIFVLLSEFTGLTIHNKIPTHKGTHTTTYKREHTPCRTIVHFECNKQHIDFKRREPHPRIESKPTKRKSSLNVTNGTHVSKLSKLST